MFGRRVLNTGLHDPFEEKAGMATQAAEGTLRPYHYIKEGNVLRVNFKRAASGPRQERRFFGKKRLRKLIFYHVIFSKNGPKNAKKIFYLNQLKKGRPERSRPKQPPIISNKTQTKPKPSDPKPPIIKLIFYRVPPYSYSPIF